MAYVKEIGTAAATLICAAGIGFFMQSSDVAQDRYGPKEAAFPVPARNSDDGPVLKVADAIHTSATDFPSAPKASSPDDVVQTAAPVAIEPPDTVDQLPGITCEISMETVADEKARLNVSLSAPCLPYDRVTLHHSGMMITETLDAQGSLDVVLPALAFESVVIAAFSSGDGAVTQTAVPGISTVDRVVLQWKGKSGFEMHAREFGADYGSKGHIWHGAAGDAEVAHTGQGGYMMRLGDADAPDARMADVYTFPKVSGTREGVVDISVEAEVTLYNCGLEIGAQSLHATDGDIRTQDLTMSVSACDTIGSFLVLNNLIRDLKVAAN